MKSAILSIIPLAGFALAQEGCTRRTITTTETERTYVTVQPLDITSTIDITTTSTIDITTTITVRPSSVAASATGLHWGNFQNGTWSNHTGPNHTGRPVVNLSTVSLYTVTPSPVAETAAPVAETSAPVAEAPSPVAETLAVAETPAPTYAPGQGYGQA